MTIPGETKDELAPEVKTAIEIADRYIPADRVSARIDLAKDIMAAIAKHAEIIALEAIQDATRKGRLQ